MFSGKICQRARKPCLVCVEMSDAGSVGKTVGSKKPRNIAPGTVESFVGSMANMPVIFCTDAV